MYVSRKGANKQSRQVWDFDTFHGIAIFSWFRKAISNVLLFIVVHTVAGKLNLIPDSLFNYVKFCQAFLKI
jgi:hypothetical protein